MKEYTVQEWFRIRDCWVMLRELNFLAQYINSEMLTDIDNDINYSLNEIAEGGEYK